MSQNILRGPNGEFRIACANCERMFYSANSRTKYCSQHCRRQMQNSRHYQDKKERTRQKVRPD
jgi:hypothetical protein